MSNFNLDDEVWWFGSRDGQIKLYHGIIDGIRWGKASIKRRRIFSCGYVEFEIALLYKSKQEAIERGIEQLQKLLES